MDGYFKVFCCVFTVLVVTNFAVCIENSTTNVDAEGKKTYNGDQVLRVEAVNSKQRKKIKELENQGCKLIHFLILNKNTNITKLNMLLLLIIKY